jgi:flagellar hook assembly protein FlgD
VTWQRKIPSSTIKYELPAKGDVELGIYNITGQVVRTLVSGQQEAGQYAVKWDARDNGGLRVANGAYIYHLRHNQRTLAKRMILIK